AGSQRALLGRRRDGAALQADEQARRSQRRQLQQEARRGGRERRADRQPVQPHAREPRAARAAALHRRRHRRARRPDDGRRQEDRGADRPPRAEGQSVGRAPDPGDAAAERRRDHRPHQGEHPDAPVVPGLEQDRLAHHPRPDGRRGAARHGRHALPAVGNGIAGPRPRAFVSDVKSGRAQFTQTVTSPDGAKKKTSLGSFEFSRPNRFRFAYVKPFEQTIVGDGEKVWIYDADLNQVSSRKLGQALGATPAALLAGGSLERDFDLANLPPSDGLEWAEAKPKAK